MRMLRWMTGVSLSERKSNECVRSMLAIDDIAEVMSLHQHLPKGTPKRKVAGQCESLHVPYVLMRVPLAAIRAGPLW